MHLVRERLAEVDTRRTDWLRRNVVAVRQMPTAL